MRRWFNEFLALAAAMLTTVALFADVVSTGNISMALNGDGVPQLIAFAAGLWVYRKWIVEHTVLPGMGRREKVCSVVTALMFTVFMIIGKAQTAEPDLKYEIFAVLLFLGYLPMFYLIVLFLIDRIDVSRMKVSRMKVSRMNVPKTVNCGIVTGEGKIKRLTIWIFEEHITLGVMLFVIICRLPYLVAFYPCSMSWDGGAQICAFFGTEPFTNHHPPMISFLYGMIAWYSQEWGIPNIGMFTIPVMQTLLSAFAVAKVCACYQHFRLPYWIRWGSLIYYAVFTVWCIYDVTVIKDTFYYPLTLLFSLQLIYCVLDSDFFWSRKKNLVLMILYGVLMMQTRNNGVFVVLFALPFVLWSAKRKMHLLIGIGIMLLINTILNSGLYPAIGVINLETKEDTYCILFQQTAKYGQDYPEDVTGEEREVLNTIFDYDEMVKVYNPQLADWVKNCLKLSEHYSKDHTNKEFSEMKGAYFKVWFAQFRRHPLSYVKTFLECSYGYYYPEAAPYKEGMGIYDNDRNMLTKGMHSYRQIRLLKPARFVLERVSRVEEYLPGIGLLCRCGFYTWCVVFASMYLIAKKRYRLLIAVIPPAVNILVCLISPVNTCIRYAMPTMCMVPVIFGMLWIKDKGEI